MPLFDWMKEVQLEQHHKLLIYQDLGLEQVCYQSCLARDIQQNMDVDTEFKLGFQALLQHTI